MSILPKEKSVKKTENPKNLIIFGLPKVGKTSSLSQLPNALIIDMEDGSDYIEGAYVTKAKTVQDLFQIAKALKEEEHSFEFVILDTITALEDICIPYAKSLYMKTPIGKNFDINDDLLSLPMGQGYKWQRDAIKTIIGWFEKSIPNVILVGHVKDKSLNEMGSELNVKALDLSGKTANILSAQSDAICYVFRDPETGNLMANFGDMNSVLCGARMPHLAGKTILLTERTESGELISHWENIYPSLKK